MVVLMIIPRGASVAAAVRGRGMGGVGYAEVKAEDLGDWCPLLDLGSQEMDATLDLAWLCRMKSQSCKHGKTENDFSSRDSSLQPDPNMRSSYF